MFDVHDLDWLLKLRLAVARCGEMDCARWWNTQGQLGPRGGSVLRRGFPRTHHFAQARSVFAAASSRCREVFALPGAGNLWWLGESVEEAFDLQWEHWLDDAGAWSEFFDRLAASTSPDPVEVITSLDLTDPVDVEKSKRLTADPSGNSVRIADASSASRGDVALLALGFGAGSPGRLVVPYVAQIS